MPLWRASTSAGPARRLTAAALTAGVLLSSQSAAHDSWINQGRYLSPRAGAPHEGEFCCGLRDCRPVVKEVDFTARGDLWLFLDGPIAAWARRMWQVEIAGQTWPRDLSQTYRSEDDQHWVCVGPTGVRCFFYDYGGY